MLKPLHSLYDLPFHRCPPKHIEWSLVLEESRWRRLDFSGANRLGIPKSKVQCKLNPTLECTLQIPRPNPLDASFIQFPHQHPGSNSTPHEVSWHYHFTILEKQMIRIPKIGTCQMNSWVIGCHKGPPCKTQCFSTLRRVQQFLQHPSKSIVFSTYIGETSL